MEELRDLALSLLRTPYFLNFLNLGLVNILQTQLGKSGLFQLVLQVISSAQVGRISGQDLLQLLSSSKLACLDVRPSEEYRLGAVPGSLHLPGGEGAAASKEVTEAKRKGRVVCVAGSCRDGMALQVAEQLLQQGVPR